MPRILVVVLVLHILLAACTGNGPADRDAAPADPAATLSQAVENVRDQTSFRLLIEQLGAVYPFYVSLDQGMTQVSASMRRGEAQFTAPDELYARVKLELPPLPAVNVDIFAKGDQQWFRLTGGSWINFPIAEGFDPGELVRENGGFSKALGQLRQIEYLGFAELIDGTRTWHLRGFADGDVINDLMFNLLAVESDNVQVDVYIDPRNGMPARLTVLVPGTATEAEPQDTQWAIELYDLGAAPEYTLGADGSPTQAE